jgi:calcium-dependent protein kinase
MRVEHKQSGIKRAMKALKKTNIIKNKESDVFNEFAILRELDHPHIVKLHELYQDEKYYYLITEYCVGGELFEKIRKLKNFSERKAS